MESPAFVPVRIESTFMNRRVVALTSFLSVFAVVVACIVGATGPAVFRTGDSNAVDMYLDSGEWSSWHGKIVDMGHLNQMLFVLMRLEHAAIFGSDVFYQYRQEVRIDVVVGKNAEDDDGTVLVRNETFFKNVVCKPDESFCEPVTIFSEHVLEHKIYEMHISLRHPVHSDADDTCIGDRLQVDMRIDFINAEYTKFEFAWKTTFLCISILALLLPRHGYVARLAKVPRGSWSFQQKFVLCLGILLVLYNDPFFAAGVSSKATADLSVLYIVFLATFLSAILLFWLCIFERMVGDAKTSGESRIPTWAPKLALATVFWSTLIALFVKFRMKMKEATSFDGVDDIAEARAEMGLLVACTVIYSIWLVVLVARCIGRFIAMTPAFKFLFLLTLATICVSVIGLFTGALYPLASAPIEFLGFYAVYNVYVHVLMFSYAPMASALSSSEEEVGLETASDGMGGNAWL